jgi:hypothetical protein
MLQVKLAGIIEAPMYMTFPKLKQAAHNYARQELRSHLRNPDMGQTWTMSVPDDPLSEAGIDYRGPLISAPETVVQGRFSCMAKQWFPRVGLYIWMETSSLQGSMIGACKDL